MGAGIDDVLIGERIIGAVGTGMFGGGGREIFGGGGSGIVGGGGIDLLEGNAETFLTLWLGIAVTTPSFSSTCLD